MLNPDKMHSQNYARALNQSCASPDYFPLPSGEFGMVTLPHISLHSKKEETEGTALRCGLFLR